MVCRARLTTRFALRLTLTTPSSHCPPHSVQVEGVVADRDLSLGHLIGLITEFFHRIGITQLRFKPAFNPYTEPSMEIFGYHPDLGKWTEIGNSGCVDGAGERAGECLLCPSGTLVVTTSLSALSPLSSSTTARAASSARRCCCRWACRRTCA
jgi:hypothetical protein